MMKKILRFITLPDQAKCFSDLILDNGGKIPKGLKIETISLRAYNYICAEKDIHFEVMGIDKFLAQKPPEGISLILDVDIEPIVYSPFWNNSLNIDGSEVVKSIFDKYQIYKIISSATEILQPKTTTIRNRSDLESALNQIKTDKIVLKPRFNGYSSHNVLIMDRDRLSVIIKNDIFNLCDFIAQEYIPQTYWPPIEWRMHFVGRNLCRCIKIKDKNNWAKSFTIHDINLCDVPAILQQTANKVAKMIIGIKSKDNFCLDFLETEGGYMFLEANCGALESFYINNESNYERLIPIIDQIFGP